MPNYQLRTEADGMSRSLLLYFTDDEDGDPRPAEQQLTTYLRHLIMLGQYSGTGPMIKKMWRWNEDDSREELELALLRVLPEGEADDHYYEVSVKGTKENIAYFTVTL